MQYINNITWTNILIKVNNESTHVSCYNALTLYIAVLKEEIFEVLLDVK